MVFKNIISIFKQMNLNLQAFEVMVHGMTADWFDLLTMTSLLQLDFGRFQGGLTVKIICVADR